MGSEVSMVAASWQWRSIDSDEGPGMWANCDEATFQMLGAPHYADRYEVRPLYAALPNARDAVAHPVAREVGRIGDMSTRDALRVGFDGDNDVYLSTTAMEGVEFCTVGMGGGKSPRTRAALVALMVAMEADNAEDTRRDWWAQRNAGANDRVRIG